MCGIFGITRHEEAARMSYFGLYALQHRGQESAGIVSYDGKNTYIHIGMGLVPEIFTEEHLSHLKGNTAIGHIRYSTTGTPLQRNAQPFSVRVRGHNLSLAHNGNLTNSSELKKELEDRGAIFQSSSDSEIFLHLIATALGTNTIEEAVLEACSKVDGAYSLIIMYDGKLIALRDPHGFHPLALAKYQDSFILASETCAFDLLQADFIRCLEPGEMISFAEDADNFISYKLKNSQLTKPAQCIFELVYFARPDSIVFGEDVYACRKKMGAECAKEAPAFVDCVMPFPDSGIYAALGVAQTLRAPYEHALIRNHYVGRTFIQPTQTMREFSVQVKINPVRSMIKNKRLCIVDDSIVRGTTVKTRVAKLRELGAEEVHFRVSCPPIKYPCFYGIDFPTTGELIAVKYSETELKNVLGLDSLHYLTLEGLKRSVTNPQNYCMACFDNKYPTKTPTCTNKFSLEEA